MVNTKKTDMIRSISIFLLVCSVLGASRLYAQVGINTQVLNGIFHIDPQGNNTGGTAIRYNDDVIVDNSGQMGIGTNAPAAKIDIQGSFILDDGNQAPGKALMYNAATQIAYWGDKENDAYQVGPVDLTGIQPLFSGATPSYMGKSITLTTGSWLILYSITWSFDNIGATVGHINTYLSTVNTGSTLGSADNVAGSWVITDATSRYSSSQIMTIYNITAASQTLYLWAYYNSGTLNNLISYNPRTTVINNTLQALRWE